MEKYPLKVVVEGLYDVKLYPEDGETTTTLNFKRGIISALAVPLLEENKNKNMPTIHGKCKTHYTVNAREDIATDVSLNRDLSRCDKFVPISDHTSPLALITGMHYPLAQLIRSSQTCNYRFDNEKKHMTFGSCTENHILIPFSHKGEYGVTNVGKQELTLVKVSPHNDRVFVQGAIVKDLHMEAVEDKSAVQDKDTVLNHLRELAALPENEGERRAPLFHKLVSMVRGMKTDTLSSALSEALAVSRVLTYQVLAQCGTPECSSAIMKLLRTFDTNSFEVDATVFALGLVSNPSSLLIHDMLEMAKYKPSKPIMYALSNVVKRFYKAEGKLIPEIYSVAEFMAAQLGDCSGNQDKTFMTLRVIGNMAQAVMPAGPVVRASVIQCMNQPAASPAVQQAAIQVYRLAPVPEKDRKEFMRAFMDTNNPMQKRIAAYLILMKNPQPNELTQLANDLPNVQDQQVKSFVTSHITNILSSSGSETQELRQKIQDAVQGNEIGPILNPTKFSRNYKIGSLEGNMIFEGPSYLPKEVMLEMTLKAFGYDIDMMEIGMEGKGFEPSVEALFGENGFFPDTAMKTMYFVSDNMPETIREILQNMMPTLKRNGINRQVLRNLIKEIGRNFNKLVRKLKTMQSPEAMVYLRLLGNELGYLKTNEMEEMLIKALMMNVDNTIFAHYIFMDNEFFLPTVTGVPLRIALSGTFTPGIKGGLRLARDMSEVTFMPSAGIEFVTQVGSHIPEYVNSGLEMHTNIFHESGLRAKIAIGRDNIKLTIPAPTSPTKLIKMTNNLVAVTGSEVKTIPPMVMDKVDVSECTPVFVGMKYCTQLQYTDAFSQETAPYFPFTGDSKYVVELHPNGEVTEYTATVAYELLREGDDDVCFTTFSLKAMKEGMLQGQLLVPSIRADATVTAAIKRDAQLELELASEIKIMDAISHQKIAMKYDATKIEVEVKSDVNAKATMLPYADSIENYGNEILDMQIGQTDLKVRHIFKKFNFRVPDMPEISLPETLFLNTEAKAVYYINNDRFTIAIPVPLGGKSTEELNFPPALTTPSLSLRQFGLEIPSKQITIPEFVFPESFSLSIPLFGRAEVSTVMKSNLYNTEASVAFGVDREESQTYSAQFDMKGTSPLDILSINEVTSHSLAHKFIEASISIAEDAIISDTINLKSNSKIEARSPLGLSVVAEHVGMAGITQEEISADNKFEGVFKAGPIYGKTISAQSFTIFPYRPEAKIDSNFQVDSTIVRVQNAITATLINGKVSVVSNTSAFEDMFTHNAELSFRDNRLSLIGTTNALALGMKIYNQMEASAGAGEVILRMETNTDHSENRVYSLVTASLDVNGLTVNSDANVKLLENEATHKVSLRMNKDGLATSGTTTLQSLLSMENTFTAEVIYGDMTANVKCSTTGKFLGTHMSHNAEIEVMGLTATITNDVRFNSQPVRINHVVRCNIIPFDFTLDAILNAEGDMTMYGSHSAQIYNKFLFRAQPMVFASSNECRASVTQQLNNGFSLETTLDNKIITSLSLQEQKTSFKLKSKINEHAFDQNIEVYNTAETIGMEASGTVLTNIINTASTENQEFTVSGLLKYNKKTDSHIFNIENLPVLLKQFKGFVVYVAEALHDYISNEHITAQIKDLPDYVSDQITQMNIEGTLIQLIQYFSDFIHKYNVSMEDVETLLRNLKVTIEKLLDSLFIDIKHFFDMISEIIQIIETFDLKEIAANLNRLISSIDLKAHIEELFTLTEISFTKIPLFSEEKLQVFRQFLQVPNISLPTLSSEIVVPSFGTLRGELKLQTPIITIETTAQFQNATENAMTPLFKGFFISHGKSPSFEILNYKLESTARIAIPKMRRVVVGETVKFSHLALGADHQASTEIKRGMTASLDTTYTHLVDIPIGNVRNEVTLKQKSLVRQDGYTLALTVENAGGFNGVDNHNSNLDLSFTPSNTTITFIGDTDCSMLKIKQSVTAEIGTFSYLKFNVRNEAEAPIIKSSLLVASGFANLHDMKVELKANQDTELYGAVSGRLSNAANIIAHPDEFFFEFQNKGNAKVNIFESVTAKIELQNDYLVNINPDSQKMNTVILTRLNQYKMFCNFTLDNNVHEAGIFAAMESGASLDFLRYSISIPEIDLPIVDFHTPAINDLNLYEQTGLDNILITTDQTFDVDTKLVYQKSKAAPLVDIMGLIQIPSLRNLITELSVKSAIINLIANARLHTEDDLVFHLEATTTSVFEDLKAKLVGTTSLTTKRGIKMASSLSLENPRIGGTHDNTISVSTDTFETELSVATVANVALPMLSLQANQKLDADTKTKANAISKLSVSGNFNIPLIDAVGRADADHSLKLEGTSEYISMESSTRANMAGTVYEDYRVFGLLDNEATVFLNEDVLRSTSKVIADAKLNHGATKVIGMDVNENLSIEASTSRVYAVLKYTGNNEANLFNFNTRGKHTAQAKVDCAPTSSLTVDIDIDMSQPTNRGDFSFSEKTFAEVTAAKQNIFTNTTLISSLYSTSMAAAVEGNAPVIKAVVKSSAKSAAVILEYNMDGELMKIQ
uniref:Apolipoprotein Bb, tandem duplicate 1 n=1 Tax=Amphilophus citrinellus TaxID=61819 RepID=A0A3Q0RYV0_AMPCI